MLNNRLDEILMHHIRAYIKNIDGDRAQYLKGKIGALTEVLEYECDYDDTDGYIINFKHDKSLVYDEEEDTWKGELDFEYIIEGYTEKIAELLVEAYSDLCGSIIYGVETSEFKEGRLQALLNLLEGSIYIKDLDKKFRKLKPELIEIELWIKQTVDGMEYDLRWDDEDSVWKVWSDISGRFLTLEEYEYEQAEDGSDLDMYDEDGAEIESDEDEDDDDYEEDDDDYEEDDDETGIMRVLYCYEEDDDEDDDCEGFIELWDVK
jgi:hypothetical protein